MNFRWLSGRRFTRKLRGAYIETNRSERNAIIVAGSARSGTTWVGDVVASLLNARKMFEPFLLGTTGRIILDQAGYDRSRRESTLELNPQLYLAPGDVPSEHHSSIGHVLRGKVKYGWVEKQKRPGIFRRRVIKTIRANLFLGYVAHHWPRTRMLVVVRNPLDVIESQLAKNEAGWGFDWDLREILRLDDLVRDHLRDHVSAVGAAKGIVDRLTHRWCIETLVSLRQISGREQALVVGYDDLTRNRTGWRRVCEHFGLSNIADRRLDRLTARRSITARPSAQKSRTTAHGGTGRLSSSDRKRILSLVDTYGLPGILREKIPAWAQ